MQVAYIPLLLIPDVNSWDAELMIHHCMMEKFLAERRLLMHWYHESLKQPNRSAAWEAQLKAQLRCSDMRLGMLLEWFQMAEAAARRSHNAARTAAAAASMQQLMQSLH